MAAESGPGGLSHGYLRPLMVDPAIDLKRNTDFINERAGDKPELRHDLELYFRARHKDATMR